MNVMPETPTSLQAQSYQGAGHDDFQQSKSGATRQSHCPGSGMPVIATFSYGVWQAAS